MTSRHRSKNVRVRFNLTTRERTRSSLASLMAFGGGAALLCVALVFAFERPAKLPESSNVAVAQVASSHVTTRGLSESYSVRFAKCGRIRSTCVVDGDTLWLNGVKIRIADIDTPEVSKPACQKEFDLGVLATTRLIQLLNQGEFSVQMSEWGDEDRYGRKLRLIVRGGASLGDQLVREGLAHQWVGHKISWC